jgi:hypothetical protein
MKNVMSVWLYGCVLIDVFGYVYELWMVWILGKVWEKLMHKDTKAIW